MPNQLSKKQNKQKADIHFKRLDRPTVLNYDTEIFQIAVTSSDQSQVILLKP